MGLLPEDSRCAPGRERNSHFSTKFRVPLGSTQPPIKWVQRAYSGRGLMRGAMSLYVFMVWCLIIRWGKCYHVIFQGWDVSSYQNKRQTNRYKYN
jgi:hypothetical protein